MAARQARRGGGGGGGGIILAVVTVLIILGLIAGYIPVVLTLDPYRKATEELNALVEDNVYTPLKDAGAEVKKGEITADRRTPYDLNLMREAKKYIEWGAKYEELAKIMGWEGEDAITEIQEMLAQARDVDMRPATVQKYVQELRLALRKAQAEIAALKSDRQKARAEADALRNQLNAAQLEVRKLEERAQQDIRREREKKESEINTLSKTNDRLNENLQKARNEARRLGQVLSEEREAWSKKDDEYKQRIAELERRLAEKAPKEIKPVEGEIKSADMIREYAIVGLGEKDGIKLGDEVKIYRMGKGGIRILKAVGRVVSTQDFISRVDLLEVVDKDFPIIEGDIVVPTRQPKRP